MSEILKNLSSLIQNNGTLTILSAVAVIALGGLALFLDYRNDRRARDNFSIERRRLTEVNLKIDHELDLLRIKSPPNLSTSEQIPAMEAADSTASKEGAYMVVRLPIQNIGDGPVDILGMLASARQLSYDSFERGIGTRSRDVEWGDYQPFYWNDDATNKVFSGISTTKHLINTADNFTRFASRESGTMRRIDAVNDLAALTHMDSVAIMYRLFTVSRGYSLGEILRQLGGGPPDPALNVTQELLQFQRLAQPNYRRWMLVQQALINLNRLAFRIAIYNPQKPGDSADPLGLIAEPDAWRLFLLHHWEFVDNEADAAPEKLDKDLLKEYPQPRPNSMREATGIVKAAYPNLSLPPNWQTDGRATFEGVRQACRGALADYIRAWDRLNEQLKLLGEYKGGKVKKGVSNDIPREGYPQLIHGNDEYRKRWFALMQEGYLISKPFPRSRIQIRNLHLGGRRKNHSERDIPNDPRVLEPFVMRTYYFLDSLSVSGTTKKEKD